MRGFKRFETVNRASVILLIGIFCGLFGGDGWSDRKGGYPPDSQGVSHYVYSNGEYIPVPYAYSAYPDISTFHYRNPPVFGNNLDQLQDTTPGLYARPFERSTNFFYK
ncbi:MAG: hypothetical protein KC931_03215 [Candidatus Omnitrophica bacterium]|nr:hypothetical protein [Candidatus Omnitrophota bacterium]MCA9425548.1 hypothetical protein [Candidatus Omnitrophota bacterium]MCA9440605.1 hypothetical protein [Candidatus Omnitrophota bacterium]MCA9446099.1 hypothetical protein [Candidatus Omnitrophota bacterium]